MSDNWSEALSGEEPPVTLKFLPKNSFLKIDGLAPDWPLSPSISWRDLP
jgi:hypothetical protein